MRLRDRASGALSAPAVVAYDIAGGGIAHGEQATRTNIGPTGPLTPTPGFTTTADGAVYEGLEISGGIVVRHHTTLRGCRVVGPEVTGKAGYTIRHTADLGKVLRLEDCEVVTRYAETKGIVAWGAFGIHAERTIVRGGTDNVYLKPAVSLIDGGDGEAYGAVLRECWLGHLQRFAGSHSDCVQVDGGAGGVLLDRCRIESYSLPAGADPYIYAGEPTDLGSGGIIATYPSAGPDPIARLRVRSCWVEGGNWTLDLAPPDGPAPAGCEVADTRFGLAHRYGPLRTPAGTVVAGNTWGATGVTGSGLAVVAGAPVG